ncbi:MAG: hypothetical protein AAF362_13310 [Pseudomonadota bacterium]
MGRSHANSTILHLQRAGKREPKWPHLPRGHLIPRWQEAAVIAGGA